MVSLRSSNPELRMSQSGQNPNATRVPLRLLPSTADMQPQKLTAVECHVWTAPGWQGESHVAGWSVQPCVRPVCAVHMTAGHNAFRGSGPGQKPAFEMHWH